MSDCFDHLNEAFDRYEEGEEGDHQPWDKICKYCDCPGLHFEQLPSGKWWLFDPNGEKHRCKTLDTGEE